jgi:gas vesicle protein
MAKSGKAFWGFIVGGAVGTVVGLLIAPEKGEKMRRRVAYQLDQWADRFGDVVQDASQGRLGKTQILPTRTEMHDKVDALNKEIDDLLGHAKAESKN